MNAAAAFLPHRATEQLKPEHNNTGIDDQLRQINPSECDRLEGCT
jgi:hypothetical protein